MYITYYIYTLILYSFVSSKNMSLKYTFARVDVALSQEVCTTSAAFSYPEQVLPMVCDPSPV